MLPVGFPLVVEATRRDATSALPGAPVVDTTDAPRRATRARHSLASALRAVATRADHAAERVEPLSPVRRCDEPLAARQH